MAGPGDNINELLDLLHELREDRATQDQVDRIEAIVLADAEAMSAYVRYMAMTASLRHRLRGLPGLVESAVALRRDAKSVARSSRQITWRRVLAFAAVLLIAAGVGIILLNRNDQPDSSPPIATITAAAGGVRITDVKGVTRPAATQGPVYPGDTLRTAGTGSTSAITYADGTRLVLVNDASLSCLAGGGKSVTLHAGIVAAHVAPQPADQPMLLATPGAKVEVLGTEFVLAARPNRTELNVSHGRVRITRISDGQSVEVAEGQAVITNGANHDLAVIRGGASDTWSEDFEDGLPKGWDGDLVATGLPPGSHGALRMVRRDVGGVVYRVGSDDAWVDGLFAVHNDSHLHITFKMERPNWLNIFFSTRGPIATEPTWALHIFNEVPYWPPKPGEWRTVTIPLSKFKRKRDGVFRDEPPAIGDVAYSISISATEDRGLVVDRIWITRGGPGEVKAVVHPAE